MAFASHFLIPAIPDHTEKPRLSLTDHLSLFNQPATGFAAAVAAVVASFAAFVGETA